MLGIISDSGRLSREHLTTQSFPCGIKLLITMQCVRVWWLCFMQTLERRSHPRVKVHHKDNKQTVKSKNNKNTGQEYTTKTRLSKKKMSVSRPILPETV